MIVTPIASTTNSYATPPVEVSTQPHSPDAMERAKAAFAGTTISRSDTPEDPMITKKRNAIRTLKMKTNASPERYLEEIQTAPENAIPTNNGQTNATTEDTKPLSPQYAALARDRRALQVKEREINAKLQSLEGQAPGMDKQTFLAETRRNPLSVLQEAGVTYDQLTEAILANPVNPELQALKDELKAVKEEVNKNFNDRDTQSRQQVLSEMRKEALDLARTGEDFGLVRETRSVRDVMTLIERTFDETGEVLDVREAMGLVESELMREALKFANIEKIKSRLIPKPVQQSQQLQQRQMRTLTNRDTANPPMSAKARAIAAFRGTLRK